MEKQSIKAWRYNQGNKGDLTMRRLTQISLLLFLTTILLSAQVTIGMYQRVWKIKTKHYNGTAFAIDVDGREYWVTAVHLLTGAKSKPYGRINAKTITLSMLAPRIPNNATSEQWINKTFTVLQPKEDVDIVVLAPQERILDVDSIGPSTKARPLFGGECAFAGFPYGGGWRMTLNNQSYWAALTKRCSISGVDSDAKLFFLDGINNEGFSGGPVFIGTGDEQQILAVVSGYITEPAEVIKGEPAPNEPKDIVKLNSGFILAYGIGIAEELVKANPIGPLRKAAQ